MNDILADDLLALTAEIVTAHTSFNRIDPAEISALITGVHGALAAVGTGARTAPAALQPTPAVPAAKSVHADHLVCLEDGMKLKTLKRHLASHHGLTPAEYRSRWSLAEDYPMVAPDYARRRADIALQSGLGRRAQPAAAQAEPPEPGQDMIVNMEANDPPESKADGEAAIEAAPAPAPVPAAEGDAPRKRLKLSPKFAASKPADGAASTGPLSPKDLICRAIATRTCVSATYNKQRVVLAPHIVFTRHDEPFMRGVAVERDGKRPAAVKLGTFRLTGLVDLTATSRLFRPDAVFDPSDPEYTGTTICRI